MFTLDADIMLQLRAMFKLEADEHIQTMNRALLALEREPDGEEKIQLLEDIFRAAHSLKGAAGAADLGEVESTAHRLESVFFATKTDKVTLTPDLCDVLYNAIDTMGIIIAASLQDEPHGIDLPDLHARLDAAQQGQVLPAAVQTTQPVPEQDEVEVEAEAPATPPAPPDMIAKVKAAPADKRKPPTGLQKRKSDTRIIEETIRVATSKLDTLMTQAGELLVAGLKIDQRLQEVEQVNHAIKDWNREWIKVRGSYRHLLHKDAQEEIRPLLKFLDLNQSRLKTLIAQVAHLWHGFASDTLHLSRVTDELGEDVMKVRMLPASTVFDTLPRLVRDVARDRGKEVDLEIKGGETELDRKVLEEIKDPLIHILRNAVDHGIESPDVREKAGKPRQGTITLEAFQKGNNIIIQVSDDGGGINVERVTQSALKKGLIGQDEAETISDGDAMRLIFASGLSTNVIVTDISGRGVGMDVVQKNIQALHGHVDIDSTPGQGTTMTLILPLTLATTQELLVKVGDQTYGIPISAVERILRIQHKDIRMVEGKQAILVNNEPVSLVNLAHVLELPRANYQGGLRSNQKMPVVILGSTWKRIAFLVHAVVGQQESVVKSLGKQLSRVRNVTGVTILGSGKVIMTLNPSDLLKSARGMKGETAIATHVHEAKAEEAKRPTILVVDDSLTTRNLEKTILETAGYEVQVAIDGVEAMSMLRTNGCDLVVSDVLMPRMDGFELTTSMRSDPQLREIPIVLVTALEKREDKERGIQVGADAYLIKSSFDQENLLQTIEQLI